MVFCCFAPQEPASPPTAGRSQAASVQREPEPTVAQEPEKVALPAVQPAPAPQEPVLPPAGQTEDAGRAGSFSRGSLPTQLSQVSARRKVGPNADICASDSRVNLPCPLLTCINMQMDTDISWRAGSRGPEQRPVD